MEFMGNGCGLLNYLKLKFNLVSKIKSQINQWGYSHLWETVVYCKIKLEINFISKIKNKLNCWGYSHLWETGVVRKKNDICATFNVSTRP